MSNPALAHANTKFLKRLISLSFLSLGALAVVATAGAQEVSSFGGNAQHTNLYTPAAQNMNRIKWQTYVDTTNPGFLGHYGAPLITADNVVITPVVISSTGVQINAFNGADGTAMYTLNTDWIFPAHNWLPEYQPALSGNRLYYAGAGGTVYYVDNADTNSPSAPTQLCFYGEANYQGNESGFNNSVFIDTPITADSSGDIFFGFRVQGSAPAPLNTTVSGYAKIDSSGNGTYVFVNTMTGDNNISFDCHNTAPALSNDESKLYVVAKWNTNAYYSYLVCLNTSDLSTSSEVFLKDPRNGATNNAGALDDGTASPMVAPDGDVFLGIFANPYNGSRGFLAHFSGDLSVNKGYGAFGWDFTPGIVPASMVPSYNGSSSYLLFCKYNNYTGTGEDDGDGVNRVGILDPNAFQTDIHASSNGLQVMRDVQTVIGFTPDTENPGVKNATHEMCVNATCVNPATDSVFFNAEDGNAYRWNLASNQVTQELSLTSGFGEPYVPTVVGPDGTVYTLNGGLLFAMGDMNDANQESLTIGSSEPDSRTALVGDNLTFTASVNGDAGAGTGTVTFSDFTWNGLYTPQTTQIGNPVTLDANGNASISTASLQAGGTYLGNHWITASYSGDGNYPASSIILVQKIHWYTSSTSLSVSGNPNPYGQPLVLTAVVTPNGSTDVPTGQVTFMSDGKVIGQNPVDGTGTATFTTSSLSAGAHNLAAVYASDTEFSASTGTQQVNVSDGTSTALGLNPNPSTFGQQVTMTATISPADNGAGTPTGSVTFNDGNNALGSAPVDGSGQATFNTTTLSVGAHSITANFTGSNGWGNSGSAAQTQNVTSGTSISESSSPNPSTYNASVTFTATVSSGGAGTPTGSVVFTIDGNAGSPVTVDGTGKATYSTSTLAFGSHTVSVAFTGTGGYGNCSNSGPNQVVTDGTSISESSSPNPSNVNQNVTFTATVTAHDSGAGTPTGSVVFTIDGSAKSPVNVNGSGQATFSSSTLAAGSHTVSVAFTGTNGWGNSSGSGPNQVVNAPGGPTTTALASSLNPSLVKQNVTFTATVIANNSNGTPTGSVTFKNGNSTLATVTVNASGVAQYSTSTLAKGSHTIKASFTGTGGWTSSTATNLTQVVNADTTPPSVPQNVSAAAGPGSGKITISWSASTDNVGVASYQVFRSKTLNGTYSSVATVTSLSYVDSPGGNLTRFYYVIAIDVNGNKSAPSAKVSATSPAVTKN